MVAAAQLLEAVQKVRSNLCAGVAAGLLDDLAYIGNSSEIYEWHPSMMVDLDAFLFVRSLDLEVGKWLLSREEELRATLRKRGLDFELRIVDGPYKPSVRVLTTAVVVAHLGVFTEQRYLDQPPLRRWAWRKYLCINDAGRLARLAPEPPTLAEFVHGRKGLRERLDAIAEGRVWMYELTLPTLEEKEFCVTLADANFLECCFAYAANSARNHARALRLDQADRLGNADFFPWYHENVFHTPDLLELMAIKNKCRDNGFDRPPLEIQALALSYMHELHAHLVSNYHKRA